VTAADRYRENIRSYVDLSNSLCTCAIARFLSYREKIAVRNHKLVTLAEYFKIPINAHDALGDVRATREVFHLLNKQVLC
jgi:DNA polymerase III epsilon subunit-like protein